MREHFKDGVLEACDEMCGKMMGRKSKGDTWWWNDKVKEAMSRKKDAHNVICLNSTEERKKRYENMKYKAKKAASKAMREVAPTE